MRRLLLHFAFLVPLALAAQVSMTHTPRPITLASLTGRWRPVVAFAPDEQDPRLSAQAENLALEQAGTMERQVPAILIYLHGHVAGIRGTVNYPDRTVDVISAPEAEALRNRFHIAPGSFTVLLIGKDGGEKLRATHPLSYAQVRETIDAMPMRRQEMHHK